MTLLAFAWILVAVVAIVVVHFRTRKALLEQHEEREARLLEAHEEREARLEQSVLDRRAALDKQAKVFVRELARSKRAADKTIDQSRATVDEARSINQQMHEFFRDPRVQRFLNN